jgi:diguanylate cyclase (GGDEF)-like protein
MRLLSKVPILRSLGLAAFALSVLVGGTWSAVKVATDYLLYQDATSTAQNWARYIAESVTDLEQIAFGEKPSIASMAFFAATQKAGQVFRYEIFNRDGYSQLIADRNKTALVNLSEFSFEAVRSTQTELPVVGVKYGNSAEWPSFFAEAFVPVIINHRTIAVVAAYVDQTGKRDQFHQTFLVAAIGFCLLIALSFSLPTIAWYRRTKEKQHMDRRMHFLALHDPLTGLSNRVHLIEKLDSALSALSSRGGCLAVHFIDVDRFKGINDSLGHDAGDFLLKMIAERLLAAVQPTDIVARLGGDEFIVVQTEIQTRENAVLLGHRLMSALTAPVIFKENVIDATVSIGVALARQDGCGSEHLLKNADVALYEGKTHGRNCLRFFSASMNDALHARVDMEKTIRNAIIHGFFELHYQPFFQVSGTRLIGFEALIRMRSADGRLVLPADFIPLAEELRLIDEIGAWALREASRTAMIWPPHLTIAVNLSPIQLEVGSVNSLVAATLKETGLDPQRLELEITESALLRDSQSSMVQLRTLQKMGVKVVMDDFGTGYSSLSYLWRFPFDKIKIDRSFMTGFSNSRHEAETVIKTIVGLGKQLHMVVTVEGVETAEQAEFLAEIDGDQAQGFFFGRPIPSSEIAAFILADYQNNNREYLALSRLRRLSDDRPAPIENSTAAIIATK